jgi:hypothetical protein
MSDPEDLVSIYRAGNVTEAYLIKNLMADEGIEAQVTEENEPLAGLSITPPDVLVHRRDQQRAEQFVADYEERLIERVERPQWKCSLCGEMNPGFAESCESCDAAMPGSE